MGSDSTEQVGQDQARSEWKELPEYLSQFFAIFNRAMQETLLSRMKNPTGAMPAFDAERLAELLKQGVKADPAKVISRQFELLQQQADLWQRTALAFMGVKQPPIIESERDDARFGDKDWADHPLYSFLKQSYLLNCSYMQKLINDLEFTDTKVCDQVRFGVRQFANSMSPTNFIATNPEVCKTIVETKGENLMKGFSRFLEDLSHSPAETFVISQTDDKAFEVGKNLAATPGKVVFRNRLLELIQYSPTTESVHQVPILLVSAIINKYYVLDLDPERSYVRWLVAQGFTVFVTSWVNPGPEFANTEFEDYIGEGVLAALDAVKLATGESHVNAIGYCIGGTLLAMTQAHLQALGDDRILSTTYFASMLEFSDPGDLGVYVTEDMLHSIEKDIDAKGYFDGRRMALSFSLLRENNLFWSFFVKHYLKGETPTPHNMLYWNSDATHIPAKACKTYLKNTYIDNRIVKTDWWYRDMPVDLGKIRAPSYFVSTIKDHIAPWTSVYAGAKAHGGEVRFILGGSGHIAGIINHPMDSKYGYWTNSALADKPDFWMANAIQSEGSWWGDWKEWVVPRSGGRVSARIPGDGQAPVVCDAPGAYVLVRCKDVVEPEPQPGVEPETQARRGEAVC